MDNESAKTVISRDEIEHVALLSRLELGPGQSENYAEILNRILGHMRKLNELDTEGVPPTSHPAPIANVLREDIPGPSLPVAKAVANAPESEADCFLVPKIIQES